MSRLQLYLDDVDLNVQYTPSTAWKDNSSALWTSGHSRVASQFPGATLQFTFNGTGAIFHGATLSSSMFTPIIDNLVQPNASMPGSNPPAYGVWYQTPELPPGKHTVIIHDIPAVAVDFIIVDVDPSTVFQSTTSILVSDSDPSIEYTGNWKQDFSRFQSLQPFIFIGDYSTRSSCNPGDSLSFSFSGSSIQLWGDFDWKSFGHVTTAYSIDDVRQEQRSYQAEDTSQNSIYGVQTNFLLFSARDLSNGPHNLVANITSCTNQRFSLDYITYIPSFTSGNDAPTMPPTTTDQASKTSQFPPGAIAGIVVGTVVVAAAGLILWFCISRWKQAAVPFPTSSPSLLTSSPPIAATRKEQVPAHMRQRSPSSRGTIGTNTIDLANGSSSHDIRALASNPSEILNINGRVASDPPPAYPSSPGRENATPVNVVRRP